MAATPWPTAILPPQSIGFSLKQRSTSGGPTVQGDEQVVVSGAERWRARLTFKIARYEQVLAYRGMMAASNGRAGTWLVPSCSGFQRLGPGVGGVFPAIGVPTIARSPFSDGSMFSDTGELETKMVMGAVVTDAAARARSITVAMNDTSQAPLAGQYFSLGERLYLIATSAPVADGVATGPYALTFAPGLRAAASAGDVVDFSRPVCRMRLASDDTGQLDLDLLRFGTPNLDFVEDALA